MEFPKNFSIYEEYLDDGDKIPMRFELQLYSPAEISPFELYHRKKKITGSQNNRFLTVSFVEELPRRLVDDLMWGRNNSERYVFGYIFQPLQKVNREILRQRYSLGHFLVSTFSAFDISSIKLINIVDNTLDGNITIPWPPVVSTPPEFSFSEKNLPEIFMSDYIDACNAYIKGDYDNCARYLITSVENSISFYKLKPIKYSWWKSMWTNKRKGSYFGAVISNLWLKSDFIGHKVVADNLVFLYKVRNKITHNSLRINQENGWWFCGKSLSTVQYLYQFLDGYGEESRGAYISRTYASFNYLAMQIRGRTIEENLLSQKAMKEANHEDFLINNDNDMNNWIFGNLKITDDEKQSVLNNKRRRNS